MPRRIVAVVLLIFFSGASVLFACSCGRPAPACVYARNAKVIFLGKVTFTNEDHSGTFLQQTLVRFQVEEAFKGLSADAREVWIDPGSFTSCYAEYDVGERHLVFGYEGAIMPPDTATITVAPKDQTKTKPLPPGFDPKNPPMVYSAPECSGTRLITQETEKLYAADFAYLRQFKNGTAVPSVLGHVAEDEHFGFSAWGFAGVPVAMVGDAGERKTQTNAEGNYSFENTQPGSYVVRSWQTAYEPWPPSARVTVPADGCGYVAFDMTGTGSIAGQLLDREGRPARNIQINIVRLGKDGKPVMFGYKRTQSNAQGMYRFEKLPHGDFEVGVAIADPPDRETPYPPTKWSENERNTIYVGAGENKHIASFQLPARLAARKITVTVHWPDGRPVAGADVFANVDNSATAKGKTNKMGIAHLDLLERTAYSVHAYAPRIPTEPTRVIKSENKPVAADQRQIDLQVRFEPGVAHPRRNIYAPKALPPLPKPAS